MECEGNRGWYRAENGESDGEKDVCVCVKLVDWLNTLGLMEG